MTTKKTKKDKFDNVMYVTSFMYPLTAVPQIYKLFSTHSAGDLSIATWLLYIVFESIFIVYGIRKKLWPIVLQGILWIVVYLTLVTAILLYG